MPYYRRLTAPGDTQISVLRPARKTGKLAHKSKSPILGGPSRMATGWLMYTKTPNQENRGGNKCKKP